MRRPFLTFRALLTGLLLVLATLFVLPSTPAQAGTTLLCKGFSDCARKGYSSYGYASVYRQMHWRMYGGHNCTNYAAYRMIQLGGPTSRPWSGSGNASNWGLALASKTDKVPTVNSVAWWRGRNHVQIVEKVVDANTIVVSEDHWGGDFNWAVVRRSSGHWPDGFIHIVDVPLKPSTPPSIPAVAQVGTPITAHPGIWPGGTLARYQWLAGGYPIPGATGRTYVPRPADAGKWLIVRVMTSKAGYTNGLAYTQKSQPVRLGVLASDGRPEVTGTAKVGGTLQASLPAITPAAETTTRQWFADGIAIPGATADTLALTPAQLGKRITYRAVATRRGYEVLALEAEPTEAVGPETMELTAEPRLTGRHQYGDRLVLDPGSVSVAGATTTYRWYRGGEMVSEVTTPSYVLGAADLGKRISVKVAWRKPGYDEIVVDRASGVVRTPPRLSVLSTRDRAIRIRLTAPGDPSIWGRARLVLPGGAVRHALVRGGLARFTNVPVGGPKQVRIEYGGNKFALPTTVTRAVTVRR